MNTIYLLEKYALQAVVAHTLLFAALLFVWALPSYAGQGSSGQFAVTINLQTNGTPVGSALIAGGTPTVPIVALCRSRAGIGALGSTLTVVCASGMPEAFAGNSSLLRWTSISESSYRYMLNVYLGGEQLGTVYGSTGAGTVTSWRLLKLNNRDYLEMMLHW